MVENSFARQLFQLAANGTSSFNLIDGVDDSVPEGEQTNTTMCLFHDTSSIYTDCCTDSSLKVCNILAVMFFACFVAYAGLFCYIMNKNPWVKHHGLYLNVFTFQMLVLLLRGLYYSYFGRMSNTSLNTYMAFRTAPLQCSIQSMTSYTMQLILMIYRYNGEKKSLEQTRRFQNKIKLTYWGIFLIYLGVWFFIWRMCVLHEAIVAMDWILTVLYAFYMIFQIHLVRQLYQNLKKSMAPVAKQANCHLFLVKMIIMLHIGLRILMNILSDSGSSVQGNLSQQISWVYILLGDAITEIFSAFGMILLMTITFTFEAMAKQYLHQQNNNTDMSPDTYGDQLLAGMQTAKATTDNGGGEMAQLNTNMQQQQQMTQEQQQQWQQYYAQYTPEQVQQMQAYWQQNPQAYQQYMQNYQQQYAQSVQQQQQMQQQPQQQQKGKKK